MLDWLKRQRSIDDLILHGQYQRAIRQLRSELGAEPDNERVRRKLADVLVLADDSEAAITVLQELADQYARAGFTAKAIALMKRMQRIDPSRADIDERLTQLIATNAAERAAPRFEPPNTHHVLPSEEPPGRPAANEPVHTPESYEARIIDFDADRTEPDMDFEEIQVGEEVPGLERYAPGGPGPERQSPIATATEPSTQAPDLGPMELGTAPAPSTSPNGPELEVTIDIDEGPDERMAASPLFTGLALDELTAVIHRLQLCSVDPGEIIVSEGEAGESMFLIASGAVRVYVTNESGRNVQVRQLVAGDFFGEISLLQGGPRTATVTAADACELLELGRGDLSRLANDHPEAALVIEHFCQQRAGSEEETAARGEPGCQR